LTSWYRLIRVRDNRARLYLSTAAQIIVINFVGMICLLI
jgi:hypothetical protein